MMCSDGRFQAETQQNTKMCKSKQTQEERGRGGNCPLAPPLATAMQLACVSLYLGLWWFVIPNLSVPSEFRSVPAGPRRVRIPSSLCKHYTRFVFAWTPVDWTDKTPGVTLPREQTPIRWQKNVPNFDTTATPPATHITPT